MTMAFVILSIGALSSVNMIPASGAGWRFSMTRIRTSTRSGDDLETSSCAAWRNTFYGEVG